MASRFVYVTYIRAPIERVWAALTSPAENKLFWGGYWQDSTWEKGAAWKIVCPDGSIGDLGEVLAISPPRGFQVSWVQQMFPEMKAEGVSRVAVELTTGQGGVTRLSLLHEIDVEPSKLIEAVSTGWPMIMASLKSLLETGTAL
ncbi:MAG TPA: SRPBCC family protein [Caulobacteraceae bacterium]|jgi:uncharacterized protein YndB with AHSA1/START domain